MIDDDLTHFEASGAAPLPVAAQEGYADNKGARIWYASYGTGTPVILLHGGTGDIKCRRFLAPGIRLW